jgi:thymidylate synthase
MNKNIEVQYLKLLNDIMKNGVVKEDRTGTGTISIFGRQIRHDMSLGFPLLTTKKMPLKVISTELKWFLRGDTNIKFLHENNCHIWDGDYEKSGRTDGELGPIYGKQWRRWEESDEHIDGESYMMYNGIDQIKNLIEQLKTNPDSRRLMVNAWNVGDLDKMTLPPCHYGFQVYTRELSLEERSQYKRGNKETYPVSKWRDDMGISKEEYFNQIGVPTRAISLMWNQRSVDTFLGLPFNIASYAMLLKIIAKEVNMIPDELIGNLGDVHVYSNHVKQVKEQMNREPMKLPQLDVSEVNVLEGLFKYELKNYSSHEAIKAPLSN